jgi:hypothetical protein
VKIAILEATTNQRSATGVRGRAMRDFLAERGHAVDVLTPGDGARERFLRSRFSFASRVARRLSGRATLPHLWDHYADLLEPQLRRGAYDLVIGRGQEVSLVLLRGLGTRTILDMANVLFLEEYYSWGANPAEVAETFAKERAILEGVDTILSPHEHLSRLFFEHFDDQGALQKKTRVVPLGCDPARRTARFSDAPRIVYAGSYYYIQDPYLLALLAKRSPLPIHCYGPTDPNRSYLPARLDYRGFAPDVDFLADYQFGLITLSRDRLREHSPATKLPYYLAHGLPVLFPEWMREGHDYPDCAIPYTEDSFPQVVAEASRAASWQAAHARALTRARDLLWWKTLSSLPGLLA